jgi:predicted phage terminase large subunit-like protein
VDAHRHRCEPSATVQRLIDLVGTHHPLEVLADDDNIMKSVQSLISAMARDNRQPIPFKLLPMRGADKETRASAIVGWFHQRRVFFKRAAWNDWLRNELLIFPNAIGDGVDDGVDALSLLGRRLNQLAVPAAPSKPSPPVDPRGTFYSATFAELFEHNEQGRTGRPRIH